MDTPPTSPFVASEKFGKQDAFFPLSPEPEEGSFQKLKPSSLGFLQNDLSVVHNPAMQEVLLRCYEGQPGLVANALYGSGRYDLYRNQFIKVGKMLDRGSAAYIFELIDNTGLEMVVKCPTSKRKTQQILKEAMILRVLQHPQNHIVPFEGITYMNKGHMRQLRSSETVPALVLKRFDMNLNRFISIYHKTLDIGVAKQIWWSLFKNLLFALSYMKTKNIIHGDIKTSNVLLNIPKTNGIENAQFYLADFTSAEIIPEQDNQDFNPQIETTLEYCAPELIGAFDINVETDAKNRPSTETDLYAVGLCLMSFVTGFEPFDELYSQFSKGNIPNASPVQKSQWLLNAISKRDPISMNILSHDLYNDWSNEIDVLSKILNERVSLEELILMTQH